jgi:prolyl-tRNA synthetase
MRASRLYAPTLKETPSDAEIISHQLMTRGGYIRKLAAGVYDYLPLAHRVIRKIEEIIRQELNRAGAQELLLPTVQPAEIWQESGRWQQYGPELLRFKDRKGADFCLGPTHEEVIVDLVRRDIRSWRQLPLNLYQIQGKFRDEVRPRAGLMRGREFIMKDAYSFDVSEEAALDSYEEMYQAYSRIFTRCGLDFRPVEADTGSIGGSRSHEFQVLAESGEDAIVSCDSCNFAANSEQAELRTNSPEPKPSAVQVERVHTPELKSIEEVSAALKQSPSQCIKTLVMIVDDQAVIVLIRGDHEVNDIKVKKLMNAQEIRMATEEEIKSLDLISGFIGPYQSSEKAQEAVWLVDHALRGCAEMVVGANEVNYHFTGISLERDCVHLSRFEDVRLAVANDPCPRCEGNLRAFRGIEVGHIFYLGTKYSEAMKCTILNEKGRESPMVMGCYGIGVTRVVAAAIEQNHDKNGIIWPSSIAPFHLHILSLQVNVEEVVNCADTLYQEALNKEIEVLYDDRDLRAGGKFKDADLLGIPYRIAIGGRGLKQGIAEVKRRCEPTIYKVPIDRVIEAIRGSLSGKDTLSEWMESP